MPTAIGLRAMKGGAVAIVLSLEGGEPKLVRSTTLSSHADGHRLSFEPYAVAYELAATDKEQAAAAITAGRAEQDRLAAESLQALLAQIDVPVRAALLVNRAGWITDLLDYSLAFADHVPVAELLAVREALRSAFVACVIDAVELDEKSLVDVAADLLAMSTEQIEAQLKALGAGIKPWRKEQKLACLAAWVALAR